MTESISVPPVRPSQRALRSGRWLRLIVQIVVAVSVVLVAFDLARRFDAAEVSLHAGWLLLALVPAAAGVLVQAVAWRSLLVRATGRQVPLLPAASVYLDGQLARYTPGKIGLLAVRVAAAPRLGVSARLMVGFLFIELLSWAGVGVLVSLSTLFCTAVVLPTGGGAWSPAIAEARAFALPLALLALASLLGLCLIPRRHFPTWFRAVVSTPEGEARLADPLVPAILPCWHALHWACWALAGAVLCLGLGAPLGIAAFAGGVLCLAVVLGFLAVVAPAGAGVREVVISLGTAPVLGTSAALVLGLTARVVSLVADFVCWAVVRLLELRRVR